MAWTRNCCSRERRGRRSRSSSRHWSRCRIIRSPTASVHGGGIDGVSRLEGPGRGRSCCGERVAPGQALAAIISSLDTPVYAQRESLLREVHRRVADPETYRPYVRDLYERRSAGWDRRASTTSAATSAPVRRSTCSTPLSGARPLVSYGDHVWRGEADVRVRWLQLAGARLLPSVRYELSPLGPEYYVRTLYRALRRRRHGIRALDGANRSRTGRSAAGLSLSRWSTPRLGAERHTWTPGRTTSRRFGMRGEVEADVERLAGQARGADGRGGREVVRLPLSGLPWTAAPTSPRA